MIEVQTPTAEPVDHAQPDAGATRDTAAVGSVAGPGSLLATLRQQTLRPRTLVAATTALGLLYLFARRVLAVDLGEIWAGLRHADLGLLLGALVVFYLVYLVRAARWQVLLGNVGLSRDVDQAIPSLLGLTQMMVVAAFANSVTVAQLGDAYRAYMLKARARVSLPITLGTILAERIVDLVVLVALLSVATLVAFAGRLPAQAADVLVVGLVGALLGIALVASLRRLRPLARRLIPGRWHGHYLRFEHGTVDSLRRIPLLLFYSALGWLVEGATIYLLSAAVSAPVSPAGALTAGLVASLLSVEPFTPGGLGVTEAGIVVVLNALGLPSETAAAVAVLNRVVNYLSLAVVGPALLAGSNLGRAKGKIDLWSRPRCSAVLPADNEDAVIRRSLDREPKTDLRALVHRPSPLSGGRS